MEIPHRFGLAIEDGSFPIIGYCTCGDWFSRGLVPNDVQHWFRAHIENVESEALESAQDDVSQAARLVSNLNRHYRLWHELSDAIDGAKRSAALGSISPSRIVHIAYLWAELNADRQDS